MNKLGFLIYAVYESTIVAAYEAYMKGELPNPKAAAYNFLNDNGFLTEEEPKKLLITDENTEIISVMSELGTATKNKQKIISITGGCIVCHQNDPDQIDYHHIDPTGEYGKRWGKNPKSSVSVVQLGWEEVMKCVPLCKSCHQKVTNGEKTREYGDKLPPELVMQYFEGPGKKIAQRLGLRSEELKSFDKEVESIAHAYVPQEGTEEWNKYQEKRKEQFDFVLGTSLVQTKLFMEELNKRKEEYTRIAESGTGNAKIEATEGLSRIHRMQKDLQAETLFRAKTYIYGMEKLEEEDKKNLFNLYNTETQTALYGPQENNFDIPVDPTKMEWSNTEGQSIRIERLEKLRERLAETAEQLISIQQQISELSGQKVAKSPKNKFKQIVKLQNLQQEEENLIEEIEALEEEITNQIEILIQEIQEISQSNQEAQQQPTEIEGQEMPIDPSQMQAPPSPQPPAAEAAPPAAPQGPSPEQLQAMQQAAEAEEHPLENFDEKSLHQRWNNPTPLPPPPPQGMQSMGKSIHEELKNQ